ncbi:M48 family metallopeptidase [Saccharopolyspora sp. 6T]|uniref:YgjP-like metallopeptidase domain-containing protein n=1 Tax=Saccharopolyspora sp. 6T TaxID=2877238 RepID=UPI001CD5AF59|nr:M48 family metallopeptidase [Saccharopolyspora sp. 6T]
MIPRGLELAIVKRTDTTPGFQVLPRRWAVNLGRAAMVNWYCRVGQNWAAGRLQPWAARMGVAEPEFTVCDLGGQWGRYTPADSNHSPGRMSLGWPLFQLPMHLVDYAVAHELAHVRIPGHRADFWRLLAQALPEWAERRAELDELGRRLWMGEIAQQHLHPPHVRSRRSARVSSPNDAETSTQTVPFASKCPPLRDEDPSTSDRDMSPPIGQHKLAAARALRGSARASSHPERRASPIKTQLRAR